MYPIALSTEDNECSKAAEGPSVVTPPWSVHPCKTVGRWMKTWGALGVVLFGGKQIEKQIKRLAASVVVFY